jgi:hypothetical protein
VGGEKRSGDERGNGAGEKFALDVTCDSEITLHALLRAHPFERAQFFDGGCGQIRVGGKSFQFLFIEAFLLARIEDLEHADHLPVVLEGGAEDGSRSKPGLLIGFLVEAGICVGIGNQETFSMSYHPSGDAPAARNGDPRFDELPFGERRNGQLQRSGFLIDKKQGSRLGKDDAPGDVQNRAEKLIVVRDRVDQTADLDQTFVDIEGFAKRLHFRQHAYFSHSPELTASRIFAWKTLLLCVMVCAMLRILTFALGWWWMVVAAQADGGTAYLALKAAQKAADGSARLIEVTGERGVPQPQEWKVLLSDPTARGGIREIVTSGDVIVSQRTPVKGYAGVGSESSIALARLNVDSDRAFDIANKQAIARKIGFSWVDYTLKANADGGVPLWVLRLQNNMGSNVGVVQISAENGSVVVPLEVSEPPLTEPSEQVSDSSTTRRIGGFIGRVGGTLGNVGNAVKDTTLRTVGTVQEFLTGERTIGPKDEDDE